VATTIAGMNTQTVRTAPRSPWQNAYAERVIGSIRRECLDHVIVMNAAGLHRILRDYVAYYMRSRTHLALGKDTPSPRPVTPPAAGRIVALPEVGGLHHHTTASRHKSSRRVDDSHTWPYSPSVEHVCCRELLLMSVIAQSLVRAHSEDSHVACELRNGAP
jgi:transposase InsO family protein